MKSPALNRQIRAIFGEGGEERLWRELDQLEPQAPGVVSALRQLIQGADATCAQYAFIHQAQHELGGDVLSEWNLRTGSIESGRQWKALLGYEPESLADTLAAWQGLLHPDDRIPLQAAIAAYLQGMRPFLSVECRLRNRGGQWRWLMLKGKVSGRDERGEALRLLVLMRDVSDMRAAEAALVAAKEAAETANRARGAFLANISHEIRTPLNGVIGMTELALDTRLDNEQRHYLKTVKSSAEALLALLNDVLDFSKIEAGKMQFETISFSPARVLQEAARTMAVGGHKKGLELVLGIGAGVPERVIGDPTRLRQVFLNLLGNAIKFTERGEVEARVDLARQEGASVYLSCSVRDTGIGIPESRQRAIFEAFSQADSSTTRRYGGTGLGLAICSRLVQLMEGEIGLESREGEGSCFHFTARFGLDPDSPGGRPQAAFAGLRALVLMQPGSAARELLECLQRFGVAASRLGDGAAAGEALAKARQLDYPYQYVFVDGALPAPWEEGWVARWLAEAPPEKLVMLLTHEHSRQGLDELQARQLGGCLLKPVAPEDVLELFGWFQSAAVEEGFELAPFALQPQDSASPVLEVLLVEDNPVNQELARRLLEREGHRVRVANHGGEALDLFEQHRFDVIFMDMQMPVMGGIEATEAIRAREMRRSWVVSDGGMRQVPIIAMTANAMAGDRERCLEAGMNDYLTKPLRLDELHRVLNSLGGLTGDAGGALLPQPEQVVDFAAAERDLGDRELVLQMARMLLEEWDGHQRELQRSLEQGMGRELHRQAHTLKGLVAIFHAERARQLALELELASQDEARVDWQSCRAIAARLFDCLRELRPHLEAHVRGAA